MQICPTKKAAKFLFVDGPSATYLSVEQTWNAVENEFSVSRRQREVRIRQWKADFGLQFGSNELVIDKNSQRLLLLCDRARGMSPWQLFGRVNCFVFGESNQAVVRSSCKKWALAYPHRKIWSSVRECDNGTGDLFRDESRLGDCWRQTNYNDSRSKGESVAHTVRREQKARSRSLTASEGKKGERERRVSKCNAW